MCQCVFVSVGDGVVCVYGCGGEVRERSEKERERDREREREDTSKCLSLSKSATLFLCWAVCLPFSCPSGFLSDMSLILRF